MKQIKVLSILLLLLCSLPLSAQFYEVGDDRGSTRWNQLETDHYRLIYPRGLDSLSRIYAQRMEQYWECVGNSAGYHPGEFYARKTPVILRASHGISNGSVVGAPLRVNLFTLPQAYQPAPMPWEQSLAVHESRHIGQMQLGRDRYLKPLHWLLGQMWSGAVSALYPNVHLLEGDAVVTETALTPFGRGRDSQFLNYYQSAADRGDERSWYQWRYGSYKRYAPNHYALGYLTIAGARYCYDDPLFMKEYFQSAATHPFRLFHLQKNMERASGKKFQPAFDGICQEFHQIWTEQKDGRRPFTPGDTLTPLPAYHTAYSEICIGSDAVYAVKSGKLTTWQLVRIPLERHPDGSVSAGKEEVLRPFSGYAGGLYLEGGHLWWSESVPDLRWSLVMDSRIRHMDLHTLKISDVTKDGRYFNPCPSPDGQSLVASEYAWDGSRHIVWLDRQDGQVLRSVSCPDGMQPVEFAYCGDTLVFNAIVPEGSALYALEGGDFREIFPPAAARISDLSSKEGRLYFSCDRTGSNEFYAAGPEGLRQITSLEYGGNDFKWDGGDLLYTVHLNEGVLIHRTAAEDLEPRKPQDADPDQVYPVAACLTRQEMELAREAGLRWPDSLDYKNIPLSSPRPYRKGLSMFQLHSWAPVYLDPDPIMNKSADVDAQSAGIGATAFFQSPLDDFSGILSYRYGRTGNHQEYRSSVHLDITYSGFYPVIDFKLDFGDRRAVQFFRKTYLADNYLIRSNSVSEMKNPSFNASVRTYLPLNLSSSGWNRGIIPSLTYQFSNDAFKRGEIFLDNRPNPLGGSQLNQFLGVSDVKNIWLHNLAASIRVYTLLPTAPACAFPRLGVSGEIGWSGRLGLTDLYASSLYFYAYGYLPGIRRNHGIRLSTTLQHQFRQKEAFGENRVIVSPRGIGNPVVNQFISTHSGDQLKLTADYSLPVYVGDLDWFSPILYIKNLEFRPFADFCGLKMNAGKPFGTLYSIGSEINLHSANLLWIPYETTIGLETSYNGGNLLGAFINNGFHVSRWHFGLVFRISL